MIKPKMHTAMLVYDSDYKIVEEKVSVTQNKTVEKLPEVVQKPQTKRTVETVIQQVNNQVQQEQTTKKQVAQVPKKVVTTAQKTTVKTQPQTKVVQKVQPQQQTQQVQKTAQQPQKTVQTTVQKPVQKTLTPTQEEIEWNKWRSNLQNQIMSDVRLPIIPMGTVFKFSFDVDKYGKVSNVQTWSLTPAYTPYAIQNIAPVIRSYQGRSILNFPVGSNRVTTKVEGGWKISNRSKYSSASDFNDTEVIKKGY
ncbi:MAG: hypothetical protein MJ180_02640 [Candidatus Gastranaerophilales bacterium]|nr:hypothetical protein [Candidatus Gastranaerophilales bacterium]